jgi:transposase
MSKARRSFPPEFKQEAVELYRRSGKSGCQVARELGVGQTTLNRWTRQAATAPLGSKSFLATEELKGLRREVEQLRTERDILKKTVAFFAKESS